MSTLPDISPAAPPLPFRNRPWTHPGVALPDHAAKVPTMLTAEEGNLLHWLARDYATGIGAFCDLGCFAGGSTARLASGVAAAGRTTRVHAYDHFTLSESQKDRYLYPAGIAPFEGRDMLPAVRQLLAPWRDIADLIPGDITKARWTGDPIEVLFVDAAKTPATADSIARNFMPYLIPGRSIVVQQDYQHWRQPWLPAQMELMTDVMEIAGWCKRNTVIFRVKQDISDRHLATARVTDLDDDTMIALIGRALCRFPGRAQQASLARAILGVRDNPGARTPQGIDGGHITPDRVNSVIAEMQDRFGAGPTPV